MCSKTTTATIEQMSETLQSSVSRICSKHFEFNQCVTIIGAICINVDNDPSDVIIKFNDCITKADLYRMAKEDCENSEYARVAEKIVLSSQLLAALKGLDEPLPDVHQRQQQQQSVDAGSNNKRKRKRPNPHRRQQLRLQDGASLEASRSSEDLYDDEEEDADEDRYNREAEEAMTVADKFQQENDCEDEDLPDGQLQMNFETSADCPNRLLVAEQAATASSSLEDVEVARPELTLTNRVNNHQAINGDNINEEDDDDDIEYLGESFVDTKSGLFQSNLVQPTGPSLIRLQQQQQQQPSIKLTLSLGGVGSSSGGVSGGGSGGGPTQASELDLRALNNKLKGALGAKVFKCAYCGKAFNRKFCLERHERLHTGVRPYACQICGERYIRLEDQKRHMRSSHPDDFRNYIDDDDLLMTGSPV